jgi:hypothetical protein
VRGATVAAAIAIALCAACSDLGESCRQDADCGGDLVCHLAILDDGSVGTDGVCGYPLRARGDVCSVSEECDKDLFCSNDLPSDSVQRFGRCVDVQAEGAPCSRDENCAAGLSCAVPDGAETGTCVAAAHLAPIDGHVWPVEPDRGSDRAGDAAGRCGSDELYPIPREDIPSRCPVRWALPWNRSTNPAGSTPGWLGSGVARRDDHLDRSTRAVHHLAARLISIRRGHVGDRLCRSKCDFYVPEARGIAQVLVADLGKMDRPHRPAIPLVNSAALLRLDVVIRTRRT